jgi:hypothetical protein
MPINNLTDLHRLLKNKKKTVHMPFKRSPGMKKSWSSLKSQVIYSTITVIT